MDHRFFGNRILIQTLHPDGRPWYQYIEHKEDKQKIYNDIYLGKRIKESLTTSGLKTGASITIKGICNKIFSSPIHHKPIPTNIINEFNMTELLEQENRKGVKIYS